MIRGERGHAAVEFGLAAGLLLIPTALAVLSFGPWAEARVTAEAMAAEASRAAVVALDLSAGNRMIAEIARNHGHDVSDVRSSWCGATPRSGGSGSCPFDRGSVVESAVLLYTPLLSTPWGEVGGVWVSAEHVEPVDLYRSLP